MEAVFLFAVIVVAACWGAKTRCIYIRYLPALCLAEAASESSMVVPLQSMGKVSIVSILILESP
jgi:hypothetical protein